MEEDFEYKYNALVNKVKIMLETQRAYFKTRDPQKLRQAKALEKEVDELISPKQANQAEFDWLAK